MSNSKIRWFCKTAPEENFAATKDIYAGTYSYGNDIAVYLQLWNNRYGTEAADDLENFNLHMFFDTEEDSALLKYCELAMNDSPLAVTVVSNVAVVSIPSGTKISGRPNNGTERDSGENFLEFVLRFSAPEGTPLKENDIKSIYLEIVAQ